MFTNNNTYKILKIFLDDPLEEFGLRELSRLVKISPASVKTHLQTLRKQNLIKKITRKNSPLYQAKRDTQEFKTAQKISTIHQLETTETLPHLQQTLAPKAIVLYGSHAKGDAIKSSDIDLFIIGKETKINLTKYEKILNKPIHLIFENSLEKIPSELKSNIINGIVLRGYL
ncbi:ArsR family transcriptional regulator [Methanococcoides sp. SA1]|nr:ArsR family transcriptional regulator [Methanococcoides sp. SA1]